MSYTQYINDLLKNSSKEELINMYELLEQSKSEAWQKYCELKIEYDKKQILFEEITSRLMKALDKASKLIDNIYGSCPLDVKDFCQHKGECDGNSIKCWKEWLLKDEK